MRLNLSLRYPPGSALTFHYAYPLSAVVYKILAQADPVFSEWLHGRGYDRTGRNFKLFHFSPLRLPYVKKDVDRDLLLLKDHQIATWQLGFCIDHTLEKFVMGLFRQNRFGVGTSGVPPVDFTIDNVEIQRAPAFSDTMRFQAQSPVHLSTLRPDHPYPVYLGPDDPEYSRIFFENLRRKWVEHHGLDPEAGQSDLSGCRLEVLSNPVRRLHKIKDTSIIGYLFDFEVTAPAAWIETGYFAGWGARGSQGFGWANVM